MGRLALDISTKQKQESTRTAIDIINSALYTEGATELRSEYSNKFLVFSAGTKKVKIHYRLISEESEDVIRDLEKYFSNTIFVREDSQRRWTYKNTYSFRIEGQVLVFNRVHRKRIELEILMAEEL